MTVPQILHSHPLTRLLVTLHVFHTEAYIDSEEIAAVFENAACIGIKCYVMRGAVNRFVWKSGKIKENVPNHTADVFTLFISRWKQPIKNDIYTGI